MDESENTFRDMATKEPVFFTSPDRLNIFYRIPSNQGNKLASQSVFETIGQFYSPSDLHKFQYTLHLPLEEVQSMVEPSRANDSACVTNYSI